jgi:exosortase
MLSTRRIDWGMAAVLSSALLWAYWPLLSEMAERWSTDPKYSHGYLVPLFAAWLLWRRVRQEPAGGAPRRAGSWWGLPVLLVGLGLKLAGAYVYVGPVAEGSFLVSLTGLCLCVGGKDLLRLAWPSIAFLVFTLPLPFRVEVALSQPLQRMATLSSTYLLQMLGFYAAAEGHVVLLSSGSLGVIEACSGLGMLMTFLAMATAVAVCLKRPLLDRVVVVASAVPVALAVNVLRIAATGVVHETLGPRTAQMVFHDLAGWLMMPLALALIWLELKALSRLLVEVPREDRHRQALDPGLNVRPAARRRKAKVSVRR